MLLQLKQNPNQMNLIMAIIWISTCESIWISILWNSQKQISKIYLILHINMCTCTQNIINTPRLHYFTFLSGNISTAIVSLLVYTVVCMLKRESLRKVIQKRNLFSCKLVNEGFTSHFQRSKGGQNNAITPLR